MLVRVRAALTCGTDVKVFRRGYHARMIVPPALFGHELAGDIVAMGRERARISKSASAWWRPIRLLRRMLLLQARQRESVRGSAVQQRRLRRIHPHSGAHRRTEHVRDSRRTSTIRTRRWWSRWPACCAGLEETGLRAGDTVAVIGLGPIGLMFVRLAKACTARA